MNILEEANKVTHGDRNKDYGNPVDNMVHIAQIATAILGEPISARDVVIINIAAKLSREMHKHKRDNLVDLCGYAWVLNEVQNG